MVLVRIYKIYSEKIWKMQPLKRFCMRVTFIIKHITKALLMRQILCIGNIVEKKEVATPVVGRKYLTPFFGTNWWQWYEFEFEAKSLHSQSCLWQKYLNYLLEIRGPSTQLMLNVAQKMTKQEFLIHLIQFPNAADKTENYVQYNLKWFFNGQRRIASNVNCDSV